jgi:hypothetical protein
MSMVRARKGFVVFNRSEPGMPRRIKQGMILDSSDPAVVASPAQFENLDDLVVGAPVERATSGPGEKRSVDVSTGVADKSPKVEEKQKVEEKPVPRTSRVTSPAGAKGKQDGEV